MTVKRMSEENTLQSVLIVSATVKPVEFIKDVLPKNDFSPVLTAASAGEAKRILLRTPVDIVIINAPLGDDFGVNLAVDIVTNTGSGVLVLVKPELYEEISYKMEQYGILTLTKALNKQTLYQTIKLLSATSNKMKKLEESTAKLEKRLKEMKAINRAKGYLIEIENMSEEEAHRYIEKTAMDECVKKIEVAERIIKRYKYD